MRIGIISRITDFLEVRILVCFINWTSTLRILDDIKSIHYKWNQHTEFSTPHILLTQTIDNNLDMSSLRRDNSQIVMTWNVNRKDGEVLSVPTTEIKWNKHLRKWTFQLSYQHTHRRMQNEAHCQICRSYKSNTKKHRCVYVSNNWQSWTSHSKR